MSQSAEITIDTATREVIIDEMTRRQLQGVYKKTEEHTMDFERCDDDELIFYRDEYLMSELDMADEEDRFLAISYYNDEADFEHNRPK